MVFFLYFLQLIVDGSFADREPGSIMLECTNIVVFGVFGNKSWNSP